MGLVAMDCDGPRHCSHPMGAAILLPVATTLTSSLHCPTGWQATAWAALLGTGVHPYSGQVPRSPHDLQECGETGNLSLLGCPRVVQPVSNHPLYLREETPCVPYSFSLLDLDMDLKVRGVMDSSHSYYLVLQVLSVLVCQADVTKIPETRWLINHVHLLFTVVEILGFWGGPLSGS